MIVVMEKSTVQVSIPNDFIPFINELGTGKTLDDKVKVSLAVGLFTGKMVSLARAAELAGKPLEGFIDILRSQRIPWGEYTEEHERQDETTIRKILEQTEEGNV